MNWNQLYKLLNQRFSDEACFACVSGIWENDRWFSRDRFAQTANFCARQMESAGLEQVELLPLKADGKTKYHDWGMPVSWNVQQAELYYADAEQIADYRQKPCCLCMYSPSTPEGGVEAEVIQPQRDDPAPEKYRGKVLLVQQPVSKWTEFAHQVGAVGILSDYIRILPGIRDSREALYDECMWMTMDPQAKVFGMHLTPRQGDDMRRRLKTGPVRIRANITTHTYEGISYTVSGALVGTDPTLPEVLVYGHLYEPGANDNASGTGVILYLAKLLSQAIADGVLPRPRRTIRFVMGDECWGSMGYLSQHPERKQLCGMVADMIGAEAGDNAVMSLCYDPMANWSFADGALSALAAIARQESGDFQTKDSGFAVGTDNIMADPCFAMPTVALVAAPALSYHSSLDRPDRIEPATLRRNGLMVGTYLYGIAAADEKTCQFLADAVKKKTAEAMAAAHPRRVRQLQQAQERAMGSLNRICPGFYEPKVVCGEEPVPDYAWGMGENVPRRLVAGALTHSGSYNGKYFDTAWNGDLTIPCCWADGKRTLWQIAWQSAVEKGHCEDRQIQEEFEMLRDYFSMLARDGYVQWQE